MPNDFELSILDGVLTEDQKDVLHINRMETGKPPEPPPPVQRKVTIDDLLAKHSPEEIMDANDGIIPTTDEEVARVAERLG